MVLTQSQSDACAPIFSPLAGRVAPHTGTAPRAEPCMRVGVGGDPSGRMEGAKGKCVFVQVEAVKQTGQAHVSPASTSPAEARPPEERAGSPVRPASRRLVWKGQRRNRYGDLLVPPRYALAPSVCQTLNEMSGCIGEVLNQALPLAELVSRGTRLRKS